MTVHVEITTVFSVRTNDKDGLGAHSEAVMEQLLLLEAADNIIDSAVSTDRGKSQVTIEVVGCGADDMEALIHGVTAIRTAIHAAGGATPDWPDGLENWNIIEQTASLPELTKA